MDEHKKAQQAAPRFALSRREMLRKTATMGGTLAATLLVSCGGSTTTQTTPAAGNAATPAAGAATVPAADATAPAAAATAPATGAATAPAMAATTPPAAGSSEPVTLRVWGYGLDDARAQARVSTFTQANPNISIEPVGGELNTQQLLTAVASGDPPEIVNVDRVQTGSWAGRNAIDPINDLIDRDTFDLAQFYPFMVDQVTYKDQVYGIPQFVNVDLFFMNLDALQEAGVDPSEVDPGNWDQLTQLGEQLHKMDGDKVVRTGFDTKAQDGRLWLWSWANGVDLISADGTQAHFNDPKVVEALTWAKETVDKQGGELARAAFSQTQNFFSPENPVLIGQTAMTLFEQWLLGVMKVNTQANFQAILPRMRNSQDALTEGTGQAFAIPKGIGGDKREAAWAFIKGMTSTEAWIAGEQATFADNQSKNTPYHPTITGNIKADEEAWNNIFKGISPPFDAAIKLFPEAISAAKFRYSGPVAADINDLMRSTVNDVLQGAREPQEGLDDLQAQAQQAIDDFAAGQGNR
jgi:multiple sugar transport system substrate-binding protein